MNSSISIRNLGLSFGKIEVLKDLNLEVHDGEFLVLLGSSGCGKSTLLNCIAGLLDVCLLYTSPSPRDLSTSRMPSSA